MNMFERVFVFLTGGLCAFILITSMDDLGKLIGFEQMEAVGISFIFGCVYLHLATMDEKKKDKEEENKDGVG